MPTDQPLINQETAFNAGVDTALQISRLAKQAEVYASSGDYPMWHIKLEAWERWMSSKFRDKDKAKEEIDEIKKKNLPQFRIYLLKYSKGKKIPTALVDNIKIYLSTYEKSLMYWRDKFGYGMPVKSDSRYALG